MKHHYLLLLIGIYFISCSPQEVTGWSFLNLKEHPKKVTTITQNCLLVNDKWIEEQDDFFMQVKEVTLTVEGNIEEERTLDSKDNLLFKKMYHYDKQQLKTIWFFDGLVKNILQETTFKVATDSNFKLISSTTNNYKDKSLVNEVSYQWTNHLLKESISIFQDGDTFINTYKYNNKEILKRHTYTNAKTGEILVYEYINHELDKKGNWISRIIINPLNKNVGTIEKRKIHYW